MTTHSDPVLALTSPRTGHFRLESGHHGELWLELDAMFWSPAALDPLVAEMADRLRPHAPDVVCGPLVGGALLAQLVAARLNVAFCFTERTSAADGSLYSAAYRLPVALAALVAGRRVAVVDDVVNAGSATRATLAALKEARAEPVALAALITLGARPAAVATQAGLPLVALANRANVVWEPAECPRCAAGEPLETL
jgi:orotate phosphoribosyltransferase